MELQCPECGYSEWEVENRWNPLDTPCWYEYVSCWRCGHYYWHECWKELDASSQNITMREVVDSSIVNGLKRYGGDVMPKDLSDFWSR